MSNDSLVTTNPIPEPISSAQAQPSSIGQQRRSFRTKAAPIWLKDFVTLQKTNSSTPYGIANFISYSHLSSTYQAFLAASSHEVELSSYQEAVLDPRWINVMKAEITALEENNTWDIVSLPKGKRPIGCKWVFKIKYKDTGEVERFKGRLVAKGYSQQEGIDYQETFSPVVKMVMI